MKTFTKEELLQNRTYFTSWIKQINPEWFELDEILISDDGDKTVLKILQECHVSETTIVNECGAVGCIAGWGFLCPEFRAWQRVEFNKVTSDGHYVDTPTFAELRVWLGLSTNDCDDMFSMQQYPEESSFTEAMHRLILLENRPLVQCDIDELQRSL